MSLELIGTIGLVLIFGLSMWRGINMGIIAFVGAFLVGTVFLDMDSSTISANFPGSLLVTLVGVTLFFGVARTNGTVENIVSWAVKVTGGKSWALPWVFFILAAIITGSGALSAATNAILIPLGLAFARKNKINPLLMGLSILNGTNAGGFSPVAVYFSIVDGVLQGQGIEVDNLPIFVGTFIFNAVLNLIAFVILGGPKLFRQDRSKEQPDSETAESLDQPWTSRNTITTLLFALVLILGLFFKLEVGYLTLAAAIILGIIWPEDARLGMKSIGWDVVLLIGGIVTYIGVLQEAGVVESLATSISGIGTPLLAAFLILYVAGIVSAFASTNAMFGALVPLAAPLLLAGDLPLIGFVIALCISASAVDSSPFSTGGALIIANTDEDKRAGLFRGMLYWAAAMVIFVPAVCWGIFLALNIG